MNTLAYTAQHTACYCVSFGVHLKIRRKKNHPVVLRRVAACMRAHTRRAVRSNTAQCAALRRICAVIRRVYVEVNAHAQPEVIGRLTYKIKPHDFFISF